MANIRGAFRGVRTRISRIVGGSMSSLIRKGRRVYRRCWRSGKSKERWKSLRDGRSGAPGILNGTEPD